MYHLTVDGPDQARFGLPMVFVAGTGAFVGRGCKDLGQGNVDITIRNRGYGLLSFGFRFGFVWQFYANNRTRRRSDLYPGHPRQDRLDD